MKGERTWSWMAGWAPVIAVVGVASSSVAFEKRHVIAPEDSRGWAVGSTEVAVSYYNTCTDWAWSWDLYGARFGTVFECPPGRWNLTGLTLTFDGSTTPGYGFTGVLAVSLVDAQGCPVGAPLATVPYLPVDGVVTYPLNVAVPSSFVVVGDVPWGVPHSGVVLGRFVSDHPAHGPTGPPACGTCYPATRVTHSFYYGSVDLALCPGTPFFDGLCNAELMWTAHLAGTATSASEETLRTWAAIKALYR